MLSCSYILPHSQPNNSYRSKQTRILGTPDGLRCSAHIICNTKTAGHECHIFWPSYWFNVKQIGFFLYKAEFCFWQPDNQVQQNYFHQTSKNSKIIRYLRSSSKFKFFLFNINKASSIKLADLKEISIMAPKSDWSCTIVVSPDPLPPTPYSSQQRRGTAWPWTCR